MRYKNFAKKLIVFFVCNVLMVSGLGFAGEESRNIQANTNTLSPRIHEAAELFNRDISTLLQPAILGGQPVFSRQMPVVVPPKPRDINWVLDNVRTLFEEGKYRNASGQRVQLEQELSLYFNLPPEKAILAVDSGTTALELAIKGLDIGTDGRKEIIVPSFTFPATVEAIVNCGLIPVFADIDPRTFNVDAVSIESLITKNTGAIFTVDIYGNPVDYPMFQDIARKHNIKYLSDSAASIGALYKSQHSACFADAVIFSMSYAKVITAGGHGGLVVLPKSAFTRMEREDSIRLKRYWLNEINAIQARESLGYVDDLIEKRNALVQLYTRELSSLPGIGFQNVLEGNRNVYIHYSIVVDPKTFGMNRNDLAYALAQEGIDTTVYFPAVHLMPSFTAYLQGDLRRTEKLSAEILSLPLSSEMSAEDVQEVTRAICRIHANKDAVMARMRNLRESVFPAVKHIASCQEITDTEKIREKFAQIDVLAQLSPNDFMLAGIATEGRYSDQRVKTFFLPRERFLNAEQKNIILHFMAREINDMAHTFVPHKILVDIPWQEDLMDLLERDYAQIWDMLVPFGAEGAITFTIPGEIAKMKETPAIFKGVISSVRDNGVVAGVDIGGTSMEVVISEKGNILFQEKTATFETAKESADVFINKINRLIEKGLIETGMDKTRLQAIGVSWFGGVADKKALLLSGALNQVQEKSEQEKLSRLATQIKQEFNVPVIIKADTEIAGAYIARHFGYKKTYFHWEGTSLMSGYFDAEGTLHDFSSVESRVVVESGDAARQHSQTGTPGVYQQYCASRGFANMLCDVLREKGMLDEFAQITRYNAGIMVSDFLNSGDMEKEAIAVQTIKRVSRYTARFIASRARLFDVNQVVMIGPFMRGRMGELRQEFTAKFLNDEYGLGDIKLIVNREIDDEFGGAVATAEYADVMRQAAVTSQKVAVFSRGTKSGESLINSILKSIHSLKLVITVPEAAEFIEFLNQKNIPYVLMPEGLKQITDVNKEMESNAEFRNRVLSVAGELRKHDLDVGLIMQWSTRIPNVLFNTTKDGLVNYHPSPLPQYRGASPRQAQMLAGEETTALTWHKVERNFDAGEIVAQKRDVSIIKDETAGEMFERIINDAVNLAVDYLDQRGRGIDLCIPQKGEATKFSWRKLGARTPEGIIDIGVNRDKQIDWNTQNSGEIAQTVRIFHNFTPEAYTEYKGRRIRLSAAEVINSAVKNADTYIPGQVISKENNQLIIRTIDGAVRVLIYTEETESVHPDIFSGMILESRPELAVPTMTQMNQFNRQLEDERKKILSGQSQLALLLDELNVDKNLPGSQQAGFHFVPISLNADNKVILDQIFGLHYKFEGLFDGAGLSQENEIGVIAYQGVPFFIVYRNASGRNQQIYNASSVLTLSEIEIGNQVGEYLNEELTRLFISLNGDIFFSPFDQIYRLDQPSSNYFELDRIFYSKRLYSPEQDIESRASSFKLSNDIISTTGPQEKVVLRPPVMNADAIFTDTTLSIFEKMMLNNKVLIYNAESGLETVQALKRGADVDAVCFSRLASFYTKVNVAINKHNAPSVKISVKKDMEGCGRYDFIVYNALTPSFQSDYPDGVIVMPDERTQDWNGVEFQKFITQAQTHLLPNGKAYLIIAGTRYVREKIIESGLDFRIMAINEGGMYVFELGVPKKTEVAELQPQANDVLSDAVKGEYTVIEQLVGGSYSRTDKVRSEVTGEIRVRKSASGKGRAKLIEEIIWIKSLQGEAKNYFPEILDYDITSNLVYYDMPFLWPSLSRMMCDGELDGEQAAGIIRHIVETMNEVLYQQELVSSSKDYVNKDILERVASRLRETKQRAPIFEKILDSSEIIINGQHYPNILNNLDVLKKNKQLRDMLIPPAMINTHGDFHLDNVLVNPEQVRAGMTNCEFKLIDPRGLAGGNDLAYEMAKILHSSVGLYDYARYFEDVLSIDLADARGGVPEMTLSAFAGDDVLSRYLLFTQEMEQLVERGRLFKGNGVGAYWELRVYFQLANVYAALIPFHLKEDGKEKRAMFYYLVATKLYYNAFRKAEEFSVKPLSGSRNIVIPKSAIETAI